VFAIAAVPYLGRPLQLLFTQSSALLKPTHS